MFFISFLDSNMFVYDIVTCWDKKRHALEAKKCYFLGLTEDAFAGNFLGFLGMFFVFLERKLPYPLHSDHFLSISLYKILPYAWITNNIIFICTNNMFIMFFNPRVLVLNRNRFWSNRDDLTKIKVNEPLILDPWMMCNLYVLLIS